MKTTNIVLYAVDDGVRKPLASYGGDDALALTKAAGKIGVACDDCERRGVKHSDFVIVRETREANEGGVQTSAKFEQLDSAGAVLRTESDIDAIFKPVAAQPAAQTAVAAAAPSRKRSAKRSAS